MCLCPWPVPCPALTSCLCSEWRAARRRRSALVRRGTRSQRSYPPAPDQCKAELQISGLVLTRQGHAITDLKQRCSHIQCPHTHTVNSAYLTNLLASHKQQIELLTTSVKNRLEMDTTVLRICKPTVCLVLYSFSQSQHSLWR